MTIINNIQSIVRKNTIALARLFIGGMMAVSFMFPEATSADELARPATRTEAASSITLTNLEFSSVDDYDSLLKTVTKLEFPSEDATV